MTLIADALAEEIRNDATCTASFASRVYADTIPVDAAHPAAWYMLVSDIPSEWVASWRTARVQVTVVAPTRSEANTAAEAVISAVTQDRLNAGQPLAWTAGTATYTVDTCLPQGGPIHRDSASGLISVPLDFIITYRT